MSQTDPYKNERGNPAIPGCNRGAVAIYFNGTHLGIYSQGRSFVYNAVSGKPDAKGKFDYSAARQKMKNIGPIPQGDYWINPDDLWERPF
jgi:hypothetical protein